MHKFTLITSTGYWGKGDTPLEAAKNARLSTKGVTCVLYRANPELVEEDINCDGMGGANWTWKQSFLDAVDVSRAEYIVDVARDSLVVARGQMRIKSGALVVETNLSELYK